MAVIIAGHQRSGTSILQVLCREHPEIGMTMEFSNFMHVGRAFGPYMKYMRRRWSEIARRENPLLRSAHSRSWRTKLYDHLFVASYLLLLVLKYRQVVDVELIASVLHSLLPRAKVVGDKYPDYVFRLDRLANAKGLKVLVIYRDARDVVSSTLMKARGDWRGMNFARQMDTAQKVAHRWVEAVEIMERNSTSVYKLRYEDLVQEPAIELSALGEWMGVTPEAFPSNMLRANRIGNHQKHLTAEEVKIVMDIAGPTMERLGYL